MSSIENLPLILPKPGTRVNLSQAFNPTLIKGIKVHPDNPLLFDFIVDPGDERLDSTAFNQTTRRLVNYFLASLAIPEKDLWVNLSPVEKNHIIPNTLIKTELGRDLLAEDYMLKQIGASLIYPDSTFGKEFWSKVYDLAYQKFGVTQVPVDLFNKIWILPEKASVYERGDTVYILKAHLKVMLEDDMLAQQRLGKRLSRSNAKVKDVSKQVLREVVLPLVEQEVNEDKNFAALRQVFYAIILAQWYEDAFKQSILNKVYAGKKKVAGIDLSSPENKDLIYHRYLAAYKKGVFNYIKEETDRISRQPVPRKYFSGGFVEQKVLREPASFDDLAMASEGAGRDIDVKVDLKPSQAEEPQLQWNSPERPLSLLKELRSIIGADGKFDRQRVVEFIEKYSAEIQSQKLYPVQSAWPVLKAITLLTKDEEMDLDAALQERYRTKSSQPELVDKILLMNNIYRKSWLHDRAPHLIGRKIYLTAAEIHYWAGGLGPVMKFHGKGMQELGADVAYIEPWYQLRVDKGNPDGDPLNYEDPEIGLKDVDYNFDTFDVNVGDIDGYNVKKVTVKVASGIDENGIRVYMYRDLQPNGQSYYTKMLYNYGGRNNPVSRDSSVAFLNVASAELIKRLEEKRKAEEKDWKPAIVHSNDGQCAPLEAVALSKYGLLDVIKNIFWAFTTHTYGNRISVPSEQWGSATFLKHMMGIKARFFNAFRMFTSLDITSGGIRLSNWAGAVSDKHRDDMSAKDPNVNLVAVTNGAVPEEMASVFRKEFNRLKEQGVIPADADYERPTANEVEFTKRACKELFNQARIKTANGGVVNIEIDRPLLGYARRLVTEKAGRTRALTDDNIWMLVQLGYSVVLMGNDQGEGSKHLLPGLMRLEKSIAEEKAKRPKDFPGSFHFVKSFTPIQKKLFLAAADIQVQDSDNHTGAAEFSEEDITANAGKEAGPNFGGEGEGVIIRQGIPLDFKHPGVGQTLMPKQDTAASWLNTVFIPLMRDVWEKGPNHVAFYTNCALSPRINRIQRYLLTSAAYLRQYNQKIGELERRARLDDLLQNEIADSLANDQGTLEGILHHGRNGVSQPFTFLILDKGKFTAKAKGLVAFIDEKNDLEDKYGYDIFFKHYLDGDFQKYLRELFSKTSVSDKLEGWIQDLEDDREPSTQERALRLEKFMEGLKTKLLLKLQHLEAIPNTGSDSAMHAVVPGGIKLDHIALERQGRITADLITDKSLEHMLLQAHGLYGVILDESPIANLVSFLQ